ncbi:MAG: LLM class flavin-dependent oxidoreductase [Acidimicrobiales bacterium]
MKRSINVIPECPVDEIVSLAIAAEELGFERCWVYDEGLATRDVYVTMAAIAAATDHIELGPGITNPYTRHPAQTASGIATLDELSGGRAFLGVGAGGSLTLDPMGLKRSSPLTAVRETIEVARSLFGSSSVDYDGGRFQLHSASVPYGRSDIEIWLAGRGPKMLALGGEVADGVMLDFIHKPSLGSYIEGVRTGGPARICYSTAIVTDHDDLEFVRPHMTYRLVDSPQAVRDAIGLGDADRDRIYAAMAGGLGAAAELVEDRWIEPFVILGDVQACAAEVHALAEQHGIEEFLLPMFDMPDQVAYLSRVAEVLRS